MSLKKIHDQQPDSFEFTKTNKVTAEKILKKYPEDKKKVLLCHFYIWLKDKMKIGYLYLQ